ncbi:alkene reductase [Amycolatopsis sp. K13G38]|uniref:Alkene reductase n=2 Tax=Amycolatopsis acididurans TaxID=2724524 RepID=A0ABX1IWA2_9PSEU|nr:alkene reductase [Amycolatopsis acididurans]
MTTTATVFDPVRLGPFELANRVVMAPMTRNRADPAGVLPDSAAVYYAQRACAGLIVTEGTQPSAAAKGYPGTPGMHDDRQEQAWRKVADAVHDAGGRIFCQLMHTGRIGHQSLIPADARIVAPSAIPAQLEVARADGVMVPAPVPEALTREGIAVVVRDFAQAAVRAVRAGLDGVELHAANGYLLHQFLSPGTNQREDAYGGSPSARARFVVEVTEAVAAEIGAERIGIRISPGGQFNDMRDKENEDTYLALADALAPLRPAYLHTLRRRSSPLHQELRRRWPTAYVLNTGYQGASELADVSPLVASGAADLVSVGRLFISNPDLVRRWRHGLPRAAWDESTFYTGGDRGYTDYPDHPGTNEQRSQS